MCLTIVLLLNVKQSLPYQKHFPTGSERLIRIVKVVCGILNTNCLHQRMLFKSTRSYTLCYERYRMFFSNGISTCMLQPQIPTTPGTPPHSLRSTVAVSFSGNKASQSISPWSNTNLKQHGSLSLSLCMLRSFWKVPSLEIIQDTRQIDQATPKEGGEYMWERVRGLVKSEDSVCAWWIW